MRARVSDFVQALVSEEIRRIVADAIADGGCLAAAPSALRVMRTYPNCGLDPRDLADEIMMAAAQAGVAVEIGQKLAA